MRDPYDILGVPKAASSGDIKKAYRRLAKKLHPDANKKDPKAAAKFAELNSAYEIVGDDKKRAAFDRGEIDAEGKPRFQGFDPAGAGPSAGGVGREGRFETFTWGPEGFRRSSGRAGGGFGRFDDILSDMFGHGGASARHGVDEEDFSASRRGQDITVSLVITLEDLDKGVTKRLRLPTGKDVDVKIPPGLTSGQQIRLKGQGLPGYGGPAGDALITVTVAPHPHFKIEASNLRLDLPITLYDAVLGGKARVATLNGVVELAVPAGTNSGRTFRLKAKGLPAPGGGRGDLFATVRIVLPDQIDADFEQLMRQWKELKPYDPGRD
jgi:DnaJ-class molecular chaperone